MCRRLINVTDAHGVRWDVVFVFDGFPDLWAYRLATEGNWEFLSWGGMFNAIGFRSSDSE